MYVKGRKKEREREIGSERKRNRDEK